MYFSKMRITFILVASLFFGLMGACVLLIATMDIEDPELGITGQAQVSLEQYWDLDACADLVQRIQIAEDTGISAEEIAFSLLRTEGAVSRYGVMAVLTHCETRFQGLMSVSHKPSFGGGW